MHNQLLYFLQTRIVPRKSTILARITICACLQYASNDSNSVVYSEESALRDALHCRPCRITTQGFWSLARMTSTSCRGLSGSGVCVSVCIIRHTHTSNNVSTEFV